MKIESTNVIAKTLQKISDLVVPTYGAKGRYAILKQDMDRPLLTDDGVTVARQLLNIDGEIERMISSAVIEAASNTEKESYDGTTLTVMLLNELYKLGHKWTLPKIKGGKGLHPQVAADLLIELVSKVRAQLKAKAIMPNAEMIKSLAKVVSKIDFIGEIVYEAYLKAGSEMNIVIEHDRNIQGKTVVDNQKGLVVNSGYTSEIMKAFCNAKNETIFENAAIALLAENVMTPVGLREFFRSIPKDVPPIVFAITEKFDPECLNILLNFCADNAQKNNFKFQFIYVTEEFSEELFLDIAAYTDGTIQDAALGSSNYLFSHCGHADKIIIGKTKTVIISKGDVTKRVDSYEELLKNKFSMSLAQEGILRRRLSNLTTGIVKIKVNVDTITEFNTLKLKLDDAIGAVRQSLSEGVHEGCGLALATLSKENKELKPVLMAPIRNIIKNSGYSKKVIRYAMVSKNAFDVKNGVPAKHNTIIDSHSSIDSALKNAVSIASNYLRAYTLMSR